MSAVTIVEADLALPEHQQAVVALTAAYALDEMGNGEPLEPAVLERLVAGLRAHPTTMIMLAYFEGSAVGIATCFKGFSTFKAAPLFNIHDLAVLPACRGQGVGRALLEAVERKARECGCVKLTLEVVEKNNRARRIYEAYGFAWGSYGEDTGNTLFYTKTFG